jgi:hypothetical protein
MVTASAPAFYGLPRKFGGRYHCPFSVSTRGNPADIEANDFLALHSGSIVSIYPAVASCEGGFVII